MKKIQFSVAALALALLVGGISTNAAAKESFKEIKLLAPQMSGGMPLMEALNKRSSKRSFSSKELSPQTLSNILWAAFGVNRKDSGCRTAPSAHNWREIDIYVLLKSGAYIYDAERNLLKPHIQKDLRAAAGKQGFVKDAPVVLAYVSNHSRIEGAPPDAKIFYSATDTGFISQNVYLYCASAGLSTVVLGYVDKPALKKLLNLAKDQEIILTQPVGHPQK